MLLMLVGVENTGVAGPKALTTETKKGKARRRTIGLDSIMVRRSNAVVYVAVRMLLMMIGWFFNERRGATTY